MVAYPKLTKAELAEVVFALLNRTQRGSSDWSAILNSRRKTGGGRLVPNAQAGLAGKRANFFLAQACFQKRRSDAVLRRSNLPRPEVALIVPVYTIGDGLELTRGGERFHDGEKLVLAMKAAGRIVADVFRPIQFFGANDFDGDVLLTCKGNGVGELESRQTGRIRDDRQHLIA